MLTGELYLSMDPELINDRYYAKKLIWKYKAITELTFGLDELLDERMKVLKKLLGHLEAEVFIEPPF